MPKPSYRFLLTPDGVRLRYSRWRCRTNPCKGTVFVLGGRAEFMEKYHETIQEITARGFDVFSFDWRGQGGSQRLLDDPAKGFVQNYDHYVTDLKHNLEEALALACPKPWYLLAHSMGAHIALRYLGQCAHEISAAVMLAPMVNINTAPLPPVVLQLLCQWMVRLGGQGVVLPSRHRADAVNKSFRHNRLTSDPKRFARVQQLLQKQPRLAVAGATFGWLAATFNAIESLRTPGFIQGVKVPVLLILAGCERVVSNAATRKLAVHLPL